MEQRSLTEDLIAQLAHMDAPAQGAYRVDEVLKRSGTEVTEVVYHPGRDGGELGPFVRKRILAASGAGSAYDAIFQAERAGERFLFLPRVMDIRRVDDEVHVVMEFVPGETLDTLVDCVGASPELACRLMPVVCEAASELHERFQPPIIHRDLTPSNIMVLDSDGASKPVVTLIDFGISRRWQEGADTDTTHFGTRSYAPPEQFGFGQTDVRSDIFALGGVLFFCCVGEQPQPALDADMLARAGVPDPLAAVILRARAFDPADRYPSAAAMRGALLAACTAAGSAAAGGVAGAAAGEVDLPAATAPGPLVARSPRRSRRLTVPAAVGTCWNVILLASFVLMVAICVAMALDPPSQYRSMPFWLFALLLAGIILVPYAITLYWFADRRRLLAYIPWFSGLSLVRRIVWSIAAITVSAVGACAIGIAAGYL